MSGVALVGYSGSLTKEAVKESLKPLITRALAGPRATIEGEPELTKVVVGQCASPESKPDL